MNTDPTPESHEVDPTANADETSPTPEPAFEADADAIAAAADAEAVELAEELQDSAAMSDGNDHDAPVDDADTFAADADAVEADVDALAADADVVAAGAVADDRTDAEVSTGIAPPLPPVDDSARPADETTTPPPGDVPPHHGATATAARPGPRRLRRLVPGLPDGPIDRKLGGVAGGIARYVNVEPVYVRAAFIVGVFLNGVGLLLYLALWLLLPDDTDLRPQPVAVTRSAVRLVVGGLVVLGTVAAITSPFSIAYDSLLLPLLLVGAGLWFLDRRPDLDPPSAPGVVDEGRGWHTPPPPETPTWTPAASTGQGGTTVLDRPAPAAHWATPHAPAPVDRPPVATIATAATAALLGLAVLLDSFDAIDPDPILYAAIPCLGFGGGLVAAALLRGARSGFLIVASVISAGLLLLTGLVGATVVDGIGENRTVVRGADVLDDEYRWGIGEFVLDLRDAEITGVRRIDVDQSFGAMRIIVPPDVDVEVDAAARGGSLEVFGFSRDGTDVSLSRRTNADATGSELGTGALLVIDADIRFGEIVVIR